MKCPYCDDSIPDDSAFCPECGKKIKRIAVPRMPAPSVPNSKVEWTRTPVGSARTEKSAAIQKNVQTDLQRQPARQAKKPQHGSVLKRSHDTVARVGNRESESTTKPKQHRVKPAKTAGEERSHALTALFVVILAGLNFWFYPDEAPTGGGFLFSILLLVVFLFRGKSAAPFSLLLNILLIWLMLLAGGLLFFAMLEWYDLDETGLLPGAVIAFLELLLLLSMYGARSPGRK